MQPVRLDNLSIEVTRKPIRTLRMRICPPDAAVRVSVPLHVSEREVLDFITERRDWILRHRRRILASRDPEPEPLRGEPGETVTVWGRARTLVLDAALPEPFILKAAALHVRISPDETPERRAGALRRVLRTLLLRAVQDLAGRWVPVMGVPWPELRLKTMKTRWGTCNTTARRVWINTELVHREPACLEYVMVHELAHLHEHGHTPRFRAILERHMPEWKERRRLLNREGGPSGPPEEPVAGPWRAFDLKEAGAADPERELEEAGIPA